MFLILEVGASKTSLGCSFLLQRSSVVRCVYKVLTLWVWSSSEKGSISVPFMSG